MSAVILPALNSADYVAMVKVHPLLQATVVLAARRYFRAQRCFRVTSGHRTADEQQALYEAGATKLRTGSKHQVGLAVDLAILTGDRSRAIWDLDEYRALDLVMQAAFRDLSFGGVYLVWGGSWRDRDGPHWQLEV